MGAKTFIPEYGSIITATKKLQRGYEQPDYNIWKEVDCVIRGVFLGFRTLSNGTAIYNREEGVVYTPKEYFKCALVSPGPRQNPVYVPLNNLGA